MFLKTLAVIFLCSASLGFVIHNEVQGDVGVQVTDFGPELVELINSIVGSFPDPLTLFDLGTGDIFRIRINLTEATRNLSHPIIGSMDLSTVVTAVGLPGINAVNATLTLPGIIPPMPFDIDLDLSAVKIGVGYSLDAFFPSIIPPVRGNGLLTLSPEVLALELLGNIKIFATPTLELQDFDFNVNMETIKVDFEGLPGDEEVAKIVTKIFTEIVEEIKLLDYVTDLIPIFKPSIITSMKESFDSKNLTLAEFGDLLRPKPSTTSTPLYL